MAIRRHVDGAAFGLVLIRRHDGVASSRQPGQQERTVRRRLQHRLVVCIDDRDRHGCQVLIAVLRLAGEFEHQWIVGHGLLDGLGFIQSNAAREVGDRPRLMDGGKWVRAGDCALARCAGQDGCGKPVPGVHGFHLALRFG